LRVASCFCSAASTCQTRCARSARLRRSWTGRPAGAGATSSFRSQRSMVRVQGKRCSGYKSANSSLKRPAPHRGCRERSFNTRRRSLRKSSDRRRPQRPYDACLARSPRRRRRRNSLRTERSETSNSNAIRDGSCPARERFQTACRTAGGRARGMAESFLKSGTNRSKTRPILPLLRKTGQTLCRNFGPKPDKLYVGITGQTLCRMTEPRPPGRAESVFGEHRYDALSPGIGQWMPAANPPST
jgi:hypothetical protein